MLPPEIDLIVAYADALDAFLETPSRSEPARRFAEIVTEQSLSKSQILKIHHRVLLNFLPDRKDLEILFEGAERFLEIVCRGFEVQNSRSVRELQRLGRIGSWSLVLATEAIELSDEVFAICGLHPRSGMPSREVCRKIIHPDDLPRIVGAVEETIRSGASFSTRLRIISPLGRTLHVEFQGSPRHDENGALVGVAGTIREVLPGAPTDSVVTFNQATFDQVFAWNPFPMCVFEQATTKILEINEMMRLNYGYDRDELLGMTLFDLLPPEDLVGWMARRGDFKAQVIHTSEARHRRKDGRIINVRVTIYPISFEDRPAWLAVAEDITERKAHQAALVENEAKLRLALNGAGLGTWHLNLETKEQVCSARFREMFGFDEEIEPTTEAMRRVIHPDDIDRVEFAIGKAVKAGGTYQIEYRLVLPDGRIRHIFSSGKACRDDAGKLVRVDSIVADISERKEDEIRLRLLDTAIDHANDVILIMDASEMDESGPRIVYANSAFERVTGYRREEALGRAPLFLFGDAADESARWRVRQAMFDHKAVNLEILNFRKDGTGFWSDLALVPIRNEAGQMTHFLMVQHDVTERHRMEEQVRQMQRLEAIGQLSAGIAHNFNNVLMVIAGNAALIENEPDVSQSVGAKALKIEKTALRGADLVKQLLVFSRGSESAGKVQELHATLVETLEMVGNVLPSRIRIESVLSDERLLVAVNVDDLVQALLNLLVNARDAMPGGGTVLVTSGRRRIERLPTETSVNQSVVYADAPAIGDYACVSIADSGDGMSPEVRRRIFEPFFTTKSKGKGTGLGLASVYGFVAERHGFIEVDSAVGIGTEFRIFLPLVEESPVETSAVGDQPVSTGFQDLTALVVDDDEDICSLISDILALVGFSTLQSLDGTEALMVSRRHPGEIHLLVTDEGMPGLPGSGLIELIHGERPETQFILMSGLMAATGIPEKIRPFTEKLAKPFSDAELLDRVSAMFPKSVRGEG